MSICKISEEERQEMFNMFKETLARYKFEWNALRAIMAATGAAISGSTALAVLLGGEFVPQDLDIYITQKVSLQCLHSSRTMGTRWRYSDHTTHTERDTQIQKTF